MISLNKSTKAVPAGNESRWCWPFIRLILRRAQVRVLPEKRNRRVAPVSKDGAAPWFETPRTRLRNLRRPNIAAPHHEAGRDRECIKLIGIRFSTAPLRARAPKA